MGHVLICTPFCIASLNSAFQNLDSAMEEAAIDLGETPWSTFRLVTLPLVSPAIISALLISFTISLDEFIIAFLLARYDVTLPVEIWNMLRSGLNPKTNAIGSVVFLVSIAAVLILELTVARRWK